MAKQEQAQKGMEERKTETLTFLGSASQPPTTAEVAEGLGVSKDVATKTLKALEAQGQVEALDESGKARKWRASQRRHRVQAVAPSLEMYKPLRPNTRRAQVATMAMEGHTVDAIAEAIGRPRAWVVSEVSALAHERGIGYEYDGDTPHLRLPDGVSSPFEWPSFDEEG